VKSSSYTAMACMFLARKTRLSDIEIWEDEKFIPFSQFNAFQYSQVDILEISSAVKSHKFPLLIMNNNNNAYNDSNKNQLHNSHEKHKHSNDHKHRPSHSHET